MSSKKDDLVVVLGAGPAGIGAAYELGDRALVLEKQNEAGGLSRSIYIGDAVFDYGGHSFHTPHQEIRELVHSKVDLYSQVRNAKCYSYKQMIPYPFQKTYNQLSDEIIVKECEEGLANLGPQTNPKGYDKFLLERFGKGITKHFMRPYNEKLWGNNLERMTSNWTGERVAAPKGVVEKFDTSGGKRKPLQQDTKVSYPSKGGFGVIFNTLAKDLSDVRYNSEAVEIDPSNQTLVTKDGNNYKWSELVSTLPINEFIQMIKGVPPELLALSEKLEFLSLKLAMAVIKGPVDTEVHRVYSSDNHIAAHKTAINHNSSDFLREQPNHAIMGEISYGQNKVLSRGDIDIWFCENLKELGLVKNDGGIESVEVRDIKYSYPVPTHDRSNIIEEISNWLASRNIHLCGRFAEWAYINSDEALHRGIQTGRLIKENRKR